MPSTKQFLQCALVFSLTSVASRPAPSNELLLLLDISFDLVEFFLSDMLVIMTMILKMAKMYGALTMHFFYVETLTPKLHEIRTVMVP